MMRPNFLQAPQLNTNSPQMQFGQFLMNNAQRGLEFNEQKRQNKANNLHKARQLLQQDEQFTKNFGLNRAKFEETKKQNAIGNSQWQDGYDLNLGKFNYQKGQDKITNNLKQQQINISKANLNKPKTDIEKTLMAASIDPKSDLGQQFQKAMLIKKTLVPTVDKNGNTVMKPVSSFLNHEGNQSNLLNDVNVIKKTNDVQAKDVEDLNKAIEIANSINYAHDNWEENYTGMVDDATNWALNKVGLSTPAMQKYNKWVANLQSVANAARNKSFGAALSGFDIEEFAKEFPASNAGDGTVIPKLGVKKEMLNNALTNTYNTWVENYGKERADKYFNALQNKPYITQGQSSSNDISNEDLLKIIGAK